MNWLKQNLWFGALLLVLATALMLEGWLWSRYHQESRRALAALAQTKQERDRLAAQSPALSEANEQAIVQDLANTRKVLAALRSMLAGREGRAPGLPPARNIDLFFDLAAFVEKSRALAAQAQVVIKPDERFGFATHAHEGPEAELVPTVFQQRIVGQYLVEALLEARPRSLLSVQRERPLTAAQRAGRYKSLQAGTVPTAMPVVNGGQGEDFFEFNPAFSMRVPGLVDSEAFRLEFTGQTAALRTFLNTLASFQLPVIVRSVEVEPLAAAEPANNPVAPSAGSAAPVPLVAQNVSRFAVVVEYVLCGVAPVLSAP